MSMFSSKPSRRITMIAYHILCHDNLRQVARQIEALYTPDDVFLVDVDDAQSPDLKPLKPWLARPNVHLKCDANIGWGGAGTLRKTINGAFELLGLCSKWRYYTVLSGQDLPLQGPTAIKARLGAGEPAGLSFIQGTAHPSVATQDLVNIHKGRAVRLWGDRGHTKVYALPETINPQQTMSARWRVEVVELGHRGEVFIRPCNELLRARRESFFAQHNYCTGANWFDLHRSLIEHMRDDAFAYELYEVLASTFIPDESFFQTYVHNSAFRDKVRRQSTRLIARPAPRAGVQVFQAGDWEQICASEALFARKFDARKDPVIVDRVLDRCRQDATVAKPL